MERLVGDWLGKRALLTPRKEALVAMPGAWCGGGGAPLRLTYQEWNSRAVRMAHILLSRGVGRGDRVAVLSQNAVEVLDLLFACGKLGAIFVPLNWRLTSGELRPAVAETGPSLLFFGPGMEEKAASLGVKEMVSLCTLDLTLYNETPPPPAGLTWEDPWMILFTGGTTGRAKGAVLSHRQVLWNAWNTAASWGLSPDDRAPVLTPLFHTGGLNVLLTPLVYLGGTSILMGPFEAGAALDVMESERLTVVFMVPTMFQMLIAHPHFPQTDFRHVRFFISGGAPCPRPVYEAFWARGCTFRSGYGMTEVGPNCFVLPDHEARRKVGAVGIPVLHTAMRIMDGDRACRPGEVGELQIAGPALCSGYWNDPVASREANPDGWLRTGDLAYRDDEGFHYIVDRKKEMYISGGENVYPAEVEAVLYQHTAVAEAAVIGVPDPTWGEVGKAFIVLKPGATLTEEELKTHCREHLARYKVPVHIQWCTALPKSSAGKILKRALRDAAFP